MHVSIKVHNAHKKHCPVSINNRGHSMTKPPCGLVHFSNTVFCSRSDEPDELGARTGLGILALSQK